ncbi:helix-turn-helix domain-containing protein [Actinoplanes sp. NPDC049118]|uniref:helix-turn-helix transcriptional regulator n=1 Tax=Actinoplanes sp. NPDC049118 TaxID=3155769 RepID=UPI003410F0B4
MTDDFVADVTSVAALSEPVRRRLYRYVVSRDAPVSRDDAAAGTGVAHHVAKFNLDRLVADGLLEVQYSRPPGRGGPGAGRPAKLYRRANRDIAVSLPGRRYHLAGQVMAEAITIAGRERVPLAEALTEAARTTGRRLGEAADGAERPAAEVVTDVLERHGYEPRPADHEIVLANCPFHSLAAEYTELVCGINLDLIGGVLDAVEAGGLCARLDPAPGRCCVTIATERDLV